MLSLASISIALLMFLAVAPTERAPPSKAERFRSSANRSLAFGRSTKKSRNVASRFSPV